MNIFQDLNTMIRETETQRFCDFCGKWITHKNWITHRSSKTHMDYEAKYPDDPRIQIFKKEEELTKLNIDLKSIEVYDMLTFHSSIMYEFLQKEITKNNFVIVKSFENVKQNDSFVFNEKDTHKPYYFHFSNGQFQSVDNDRNLYLYMFDLKHQNVIIFKANKTTQDESLSRLVMKVDMKEYVVKKHQRDDDYTDETRMRIFSNNMKKLRENVSDTITINDVLELDYFKNFDDEKYEITNDGIKRIKLLLCEETNVVKTA